MQEIELEKLPDVKMDDSQGYHLYTDGSGSCYPSVTTILHAVSYSEHIVRWANNLGFRHERYEDTLNRTAVEGTIMHALNQCFVDPDHGEIPSIQDPMLLYYAKKRNENFRIFMKEHEGHWKTFLTEHAFISHTYKMGGTTDWLADWHGKLTLFDYKSSSGLRQKHLLQLGGYLDLLDDNGIHIDQAGILLCRRDRCIPHIFDRQIIEHCADIFRTVHRYADQSKFLDELVYSGT